MKVNVKQRLSTDKKTARLYIDVCQGKQRSRRVLEYWVFVRGSKKLTPEQVEHNNQALVAAERERNKLENELLNGADIRRKTKAATLKDLAAVYISEKERTENTAKTFKQMLQYIDAKTPTESLNTDKINELYKQLRKADGISNNTALLYRAKLDALVRYGIKKGYCKAGILDQVDEKQKADHHEREFLTADELNLLLADYNETGKNWQRVFLFSCFTGLRYSDVVGLTWDDVRTTTTADGTLYELHLTTRKTSTFVAVPLNKQAVRLLPQHHFGGAVFYVPDVSSIRKNLLAWRDKTAERLATEGKTAQADELKRKNISFHTARHTFATLALNNGVELYTVSKLLGHHSISTTQIYADVISNTKQQAVAALDNLVK